MKNLVGVVILAAVCVALAIALATTKKQAREQQQRDAQTITTLSNQLGAITRQFEDQRQVNLELEQKIESWKREYADLTNRFTETAAALTKTAESLKLTEEEVRKRETRIAELESQNASLDARAAELSQQITNLTAQIEETKRKLAASEGDKAFLEKELKRLLAEKAELERQFNDLTVLRAQVAKLREELNIARRLEWIRKGLFAVDERKGAQLLTQPKPAAPRPTNTYDLNVEVSADGSVRVIPPLTNAPAAPAKP
jgi:chromosome segregation ATPase